MPQNRTKKTKTSKSPTPKQKVKTGAKMGFWGRVKSAVIKSQEVKKH